jgi:membrane protein
MLERVRELASAPLIPYLVVASALVPRTENESFADTLIERFDLQGRAADGVRALFATAGEVESGITIIGIAILLVTVVSFARALQTPMSARITWSRAGRRSPA